ncbi:MAG: signal peptidase I [Acidimicrobiales bacterium]
MARKTVEEVPGRELLGAIDAPVQPRGAARGGDGPPRTGGRGTGGGGGDGHSEPGAGPTGRRSGRWLVEWAVIVVVAVVVAFVVRTFVAQTYYIPSTSMYPTLKTGERIVVDKLAYDFGSIHRGDIVVFKRPPAENCGGKPVPDLVKRVIGLPGNVISARGGQVYVTGKELPEPWLPHASTTYTTPGTFLAHPYTVPAGDYFMMGDDRRISCDSRSWGPVERSYVVGKVDLIVWPFSQLRFF